MIEKINYIHSNRPEVSRIKLFLEKTFEEFEKELIQLRNTIYGFNYEKPEYIFALNERAWLGVFNNAIIRAFPSCATLQEYGVYKEKKYVGRADFLVYWKDSDSEFYLLFEAKQYTEKSIKNLLNDSETDFAKVRDQGMKYIIAEPNYYKSKENVYVIPLFFGWMQGAKKVERAKQYFNDDFDKDSHLTDFCNLYFENTAQEPNEVADEKINGMWVYGKIYDSKKY